MARIRTVKPEMAQDEDLAGVSIEAQLLAIRLLNHADDEGYFKANPALVKATCFPLIDSVNVPGMLRELSDIGYIRLSDGSDGKSYGFVVSFSKHQRVSKPYPSKIKELAPFHNHSTTIPQPFQERSALEKEGNRKGKERNICAHTDSRFDEWYEKYPKKKGKVEARKHWKQKKLDRIADKIIADTVQRTKVEWKDPQFIPMASTYVFQERWEDEIEPERLIVPADDDTLWEWAKQHNFPAPGSDTYKQYRQRLNGLVRRQQEAA